MADTLAAGDGLCDAAVAARITAAGPAVIDILARHGVRFDRAADGELAVGLEAAHARRRIVHAAGDATGAEIVRALRDAVLACPSVDGAGAHAAVVAADRGRRPRGTDRGVVLEQDGQRTALATGQVVLATGGLGALFRDTTNPMGATGSGLAAAARAGARLGDLEFVQFHPTALAVPGSVADAPLRLVSEAVRGEGATLIDETGARFMESELAPRDVVSRAVWHHLGAGHAVFLDARTALGNRFERRFPGIAACCRARGIDPATMPIPVRPAAHYHMGGVVVDADGRSSVPGPVCLRRGRLHRAARRQPAGQQLAAGGRGRRGGGGGRDRPRGAREASADCLRRSRRRRHGRVRWRWCGRRWRRGWRAARRRLGSRLQSRRWRRWPTPMTRR